MLWQLSGLLLGDPLSVSYSSYLVMHSFHKPFVLKFLPSLSIGSIDIYKEGAEVLLTKGIITVLATDYFVPWHQKALPNMLVISLPELFLDETVVFEGLNSSDHIS